MMGISRTKRCLFPLRTSRFPVRFRFPQTSETLGLIEKDSAGKWVPTDKGVEIGIVQTAPNEQGDYWCVYTEAAMRAISRTILE